MKQTNNVFKPGIYSTMPTGIVEITECTDEYVVIEGVKCPIKKKYNSIYVNYGEGMSNVYIVPCFRIAQ